MVDELRLDFRLSSPKSFSVSAPNTSSERSPVNLSGKANAHPLKSIQEHWRIDLVREVARGGMSVVYEGRLAGVDGFAKTVAVKMLLEKWCNNNRFMQLCAGEAKLVSDLVHENIVQILQLGCSGSGDYYVVMEFVNGLPLRRLLDHHIHRVKSLPVPLAVHIASRIARGLAYAHTFQDNSGRCLDIVHRDVCPSNILITREGLAKLTDFGIAKAASMTSLGDHILAGKVNYMAPEQADCLQVDFRADQFALGAVLFEMLAGTPLRPDELDPQDVPFAELEIPWHSLPSDVDPDLVGVLKRCLSPDPAARYDETSELATTLEWIIYRDGYGPTIQTVEAHLRQEIPALYQNVPPSPPDVFTSAETVVDG
jgi:serine/threonine protein kinase